MGREGGRKEVHPSEKYRLDDSSRVVFLSFSGVVDVSWCGAEYSGMHGLCSLELVS